MTDLTSEEIEMREDTDVLGHIRRENERREEEAEEGDYIFLVTERLADRYDNVYEYERAMAMDSYSDCYKENVGIRPSLNWDWTLSEVREKLDRLYKNY